MSNWWVLFIVGLSGWYNGWEVALAVFFILMVISGLKGDVEAWISKV